MAARVRTSYGLVVALIVNFCACADMPSPPLVEPLAIFTNSTPRYCDGPIVENVTVPVIDCGSLARSLYPSWRTQIMASISFYSPSAHKPPSEWDRLAAPWLDAPRQEDAMAAPQVWRLGRCQVTVGYSSSKNDTRPVRILRNTIAKSIDLLRRDCVEKFHRPRGRFSLDTTAGLRLSLQILADASDPEFQRIVDLAAAHPDDKQFLNERMKEATRYLYYEGEGPYP